MTSSDRPAGLLREAARDKLLTAAKGWHDSTVIRVTAGDIRAAILAGAPADRPAGLREAFECNCGKPWDEHSLHYPRAALSSQWDAILAGAPSEGLDAISTFINAAQADMYGRMREGERRGWRDSWRTDYPDERVVPRLQRAVDDLGSALRYYRMDSVGIDEVRKRAADVANQAFMLADAARLAEKGA